MRALVKLKRGKGNIALMEVEKPVPNEDEVLIKVKAIGVCGTDYHIYTDEYDTCPPMIIGHEFSGIVVEIGKKVKNVKIDDRVVSEVNVNTCGVCRFCKTGNYQVCPSKQAPGTHIDGAYAEFIKMPSHLIHQIPENVTFEEAAVVEPSAIVAHSLLERAKVEPEDFIVVMGPGPIGLLATQMAKIYGARTVMVVGTDVDKNKRLPLAQKLKADYVMNGSVEDVKQKVLEMTNGLGADLVVECSGAAPAINSGIEILRKQGRMCVIGIPGPEKIQINWKKAVIKAINVIFTFSSSSLGWDRVLSMLKRDALDVKSLISHKEPLENWEKVFKETEKGNVIKAVLIP